MKLVEKKFGEGDKVLLPTSALEHLTDALYRAHGTRHLPNPLCLRLSCGASSKLAGVLEFTAPEGHVVVPDWLLAALGATLHSPLRVASRRFS